MYAYYEPQLYDVTFSGSHVSFSINPLQVPYTLTSQITLTPASGYYFESISCSTGYTVSGFASGTSHYSTQTITITNNTYVGGGSCTVKMHARSYAATVNTSTYGASCRTENQGYNAYTNTHCNCPHGNGNGAGHCNYDISQGMSVSWIPTCDNGGALNGNFCVTGTTRYCSCPGGGTESNGTCYKTVYTCPNGGILQGAMCVFN